MVLVWIPPVALPETRIPVEVCLGGHLKKGWQGRGGVDDEPLMWLLECDPAGLWETEEAQPADWALREKGAGYSYLCLHQVLSEGFLKPPGRIITRYFWRAGGVGSGGQGSLSHWRKCWQLESSVSERVALVMEREDVQRQRPASRPQRPRAQFQLRAYQLCV